MQALVPCGIAKVASAAPSLQPSAALIAGPPACVGVEDGGIPLVLQPPNAGDFTGYAAELAGQMLLGCGRKRIARIVYQVDLCVGSRKSSTIPLDMPKLAARGFRLSQNLSLEAA